LRPKPDISVIIPTRNRPDYLARCLDGFARQALAEASFEVIVVDDGSDEPLDPVIEPFRDTLDIRFERRDHQGPGAARNTAIGLAAADLLILFDDDQQPLAKMVERCVAFHRQYPDEENFELLRIGPDPAQPRTPESIAMFEGQQMFSYPRPGVRLGEAYSWFWGGAVTCKRSIFRYGLYDPDYAMVEDAELGLRLSKWLDLNVHIGLELHALQLRNLSVAQLLLRACRMGYHHLIWQRNWPRDTDVGKRHMYRNAEKIVSQGPPLHEQAAGLEARARELGVIGAELNEATKSALSRFVDDLRRASDLARALAWLAARRDEPLESLLARTFPES